MDVITLTAAKGYTDKAVEKLIESGNAGTIVDPTLSIKGVAADAKTTGDRLGAIEYQTVTTDVAYEHKNLPEGEKSVTFDYDGVWGDKAYICTGEDLIPRGTFNKAFPYNGISITKEGYVYHITGTATAGATILLGDVDNNFNMESIKGLNGRTLKLIGFSEEPMGSNIRALVQFYDETMTDLSGQIKKPIASTTLSNVSEITIPDGSVYMRVGLMMLKDVTFDNKIQIYLSFNDKFQSTTEFDAITVDSVEGNNIMTFPYPSVLTTRLSLKSYIEYITDNSEGLVDFGEGTVTYLTPEDFGAVGDGKTDDSEAIALCFEKASSKQLVLMAKRYYVTKPIVIGSNLNIIANRIIYEGSETAIKIVGKRNTLKIHSINSTAVGISFEGTDSVIFYNSVEVTESVSQSHGIIFVPNTVSIWQNTIRFSHIQAGGSGCYAIAYLHDENSGFIAENNFYGGQINNCEWAVYKIRGNSRCYGFQIEGDVQGGFYIEDGVTIFHPRIAESQRDGNLPIYKFKSTSHNTIYDSSGIYINQIDLTEAIDQTISPNGFEYPLGEYGISVINGRIISSNIKDGQTSGQNSIYSTKTYLWGKYLIFTPYMAYRKVVTTTTLDTRLIGTETTVDEIVKLTQLPTKFVVNTVNTEIYLHPSYCAFGYNEFEVEQANGFTCKVYDVKGTLLFDGTEQGDGLYKFNVYKDCDLVKSSSTTWGGQLMSDFLGHYWEITKQDLIVTDDNAGNVALKMEVVSI